MSVAVLVPFRGGCPHRDAAWSWVRDHLTERHYDVVRGAAPDGPWCKAAAVADALSRTDADVLVIHDADVWVPGLPFAIAAVDRGEPWAMPHVQVHRLDEPSTAAVLAGGPFDEAHLTEPPYAGWPGGGCVVLRRSTYEQVPLDAGFVGWGQEDEAWAMALEAIHGRAWREKSPLWHLWHPPAPRMNRTAGSTESWHRLQRYRDARHSPEAMTTLIEEVMACSSR